MTEVFDARHWHEAAEVARGMALLPGMPEARRDLLHRCAMHFEVEAIKALARELPRPGVVLNLADYRPSEPDAQ
jgi:hypothetical protein